MEELMDFIHELRQGDRIRAAEKKGVAEGVAIGEDKGVIKTIRTFLENRSKSRNLNIREIAADFGVDETLIRSLMPA